MALKIEIFLPKENTDDLSDKIQSTVLSIGDVLSVDFGNTQPEDQFDLDNLNSFIIIKDEELPNPENFVEEDLYFVIPIGE